MPQKQRQAAITINHHAKRNIQGVGRIRRAALFYFTEIPHILFRFIKQSADVDSDLFQFPEFLFGIILCVVIISPVIYFQQLPFFPAGEKKGTDHLNCDLIQGHGTLPYKKSFRIIEEMILDGFGIFGIQSALLFIVFQHGSYFLVFASYVCFHTSVGRRDELFIQGAVCPEDSVIRRFPAVFVHVKQDPFSLTVRFRKVIHKSQIISGGFQPQSSGIDQLSVSVPSLINKGKRIPLRIRGQIFGEQPPCLFVFFCKDIDLSGIVQILGADSFLFRNAEGFICVKEDF